MKWFQMLLFELWTTRGVSLVVKYNGKIPQNPESETR